MLPETGERLTKERFEELHNSSEPHLIVLFNNTLEAVDSVFRNPLVMVASDGDKAHPQRRSFDTSIPQYESIAIFVPLPC